MRYWALAIGVALALGCGAKSRAPAASEPDREIDAESAAAAKKIEGRYTVVEMLVGGKQDKRAGEAQSFLIKDGKIVIERGGVKRVMMFSVDPSSQPGHIDMTFPDDNKTTKGIYEIKENENEVEVCLAFSEDVGNNVRPKDFGGAEGILIKLFRKKAR